MNWVSNTIVQSLEASSGFQYKHHLQDTDDDHALSTLPISFNLSLMDIIICLFPGAIILDHEVSPCRSMKKFHHTTVSQHAQVPFDETVLSNIYIFWLEEEVPHVCCLVKAT